MGDIALHLYLPKFMATTGSYYRYIHVHLAYRVFIKLSPEAICCCLHTLCLWHDVDIALHIHTNLKMQLPCKKCSAQDIRGTRRIKGGGGGQRYL